MCCGLQPHGWGWELSTAQLSTAQALPHGCEGLYACVWWWGAAAVHRCKGCADRATGGVLGWGCIRLCCTARLHGKVSAASISASRQHTQPADPSASFASTLLLHCGRHQHLPCPALTLVLTLAVTFAATLCCSQGEADSALDIMWRKKVTDGQAA